MPYIISSVSNVTSKQGKVCMWCLNTGCDIMSLAEKHSRITLLKSKQ